MNAKTLVTVLALVAIPAIAQESSQAVPIIKTIKLSGETLALDAVLLRDVPARTSKVSSGSATSSDSAQSAQSTVQTTVTTNTAAKTITTKTTTATARDQ